MGCCVIFYPIMLQENQANLWQRVACNGIFRLHHWLRGRGWKFWRAICQTNASLSWSEESSSSNNQMAGLGHWASLQWLFDVLQGVSALKSKLRQLKSYKDSCAVKWSPQKVEARKLSLCFFALTFAFPLNHGEMLSCFMIPYYVILYSTLLLASTPSSTTKPSVKVLLIKM